MLVHIRIKTCRSLKVNVDRSIVQQAIAMFATRLYPSCRPVHAKPSCTGSLVEQCLLVEVELVVLTRALHLTGVRVLQILLDDVVSVLAHRSETSLLHNGSNHSTRERIVANNQAVKIHLGRE